VKFPTFADLDQDQRRVYSESPQDKGVLIVGPPGSGKTVLAMHRATRLSKSGDVIVGMFNKTLRQYTSNFEGLPKNVKVVHIHEWAKEWYESAFGKGSFPTTYGKPWEINWAKIDQNIASATDTQKSKLHWGHLIIDEGQDFPKKMYVTLMNYLNNQKDPTITLSVFADENQTITDVNSTISEIRTEINATARNMRYWRVDKNYRNTKEVAKFARHFQVLGAGTVSLPDHEGIKPVVFVNKDLNSQIQHIANYCNVQTNKEVGVVVFGANKDVKFVYTAIKATLDSNQSKYHVQTYIGKNTFKLNDWESLKFDKPPSITIIHQANSKGLEFDVVFVINLAGLYLRAGNEIDGFKKLYVVSSRPREHLFFMVEGSPDNGGFKDVLRLFPNHNDNESLCTYKTLEKDLQNPVLEDMLNDVDWLPSASTVARQLYGDLAKKLSELNIDKTKQIIIEAVSGQFEYGHIPQLINDRLSEANNIEESILDTLVELNNFSIKEIKDKVGLL